MKSDKQALTNFISNQVLWEHSSHDLQELIDNMPEDTEEAASDFCDALDLGNWFYDAMILADVDISEVMIDIAESRRVEEAELAKE